MLLITGASGFVGRYLLRTLIQKHKYKPSQILAYLYDKEKETDSEKFLKEQKVKIEYGDITKQEDIKKLFKKYKFKEVIHLAAMIKSESVKPFVDVNIHGTKYIVEASEKAKVKKFIFTSTDFVLYKTRNIYRDTKLEAENIVKKSKLNYTILRPAPIYGPGDDKNFDSLIPLIEKFPIIPAVRCIMQPVYVQDIVDAIIACLKSKNTTRKEYNLPGGSIVTFKQILLTIAKIRGLKRTVITFPNFIMNTAIKIYEVTVPRPVVRYYQVSKWIMNRPISLEQQKKDFNYNPISFEEGMKITLKN